MQSGKEIWTVYVMLQHENFHQKILQKISSGNCVCINYGQPLLENQVFETS